MLRDVGVAFLLASAVLASPVSGQTPDGFQDILKGVERGKRFHPVWPPMIGQSPLGVLVAADNPGKLRATFESIESPEHRSPGFDFLQGRTDYVPPELTSNKQRSVKVDLSELIGLLNQGAASTSSASTPASTSSTEKPKESTTAGDAPKAPAAAGVDWSKVSQVTRRTGIVSVEYYTLGTLNALNSGTDAIKKSTRDFLTPKQNGWVMHRVLRVDGVEYELAAKTDFDASFRAGLLKWIPGVSVDWASAKTLVLKVPVPVYIGYKLWRPGEKPEGAAGVDVDLEGLTSVGVELGAEEIAKVYQQHSGAK